MKDRFLNSAVLILIWLFIGGATIYVITKKGIVGGAGWFFVIAWVLLFMGVGAALVWQEVTS